jgi:hypothetical protein
MRIKEKKKEKKKRGQTRKQENRKQFEKTQTFKITLNRVWYRPRRGQNGG